MKFSVTKTLNQAGATLGTPQNNTTTADNETTTVDLPFAKVAAYIGGVTAVISTVITLSGKVVDLVSALNKPTPPPVVLTADNLKTYQAILSIQDKDVRQKTLVFFVENRLIPGDPAKLKNPAEIPLWPVATGTPPNR
jgi:hypothetical protein